MERRETPVHESVSLDMSKEKVVGEDEGGREGGVKTFFSFSFACLASSSFRSYTIAKNKNIEVFSHVKKEGNKNYEIKNKK